MSWSNDAKPSGTTTSDSLSYLTLWADPIALWSSAISTTVDSYSEANQDNFTGISSTFALGFGQTFTVTTSSRIAYSKFYLNKTNSPIGNAVAKIYNLSSNLPTGAALATSDNFLVSTLTGSLALTTFTFSGSNSITLSPGTYGATCEYSGGDSSNFISFGYDGSSPTHPGSNLYQTSGGVWVSFPYDTIFYVISESGSQSYTWGNPDLYSGDSKPSGSYSNDMKPT